MLAKNTAVVGALLLGMLACGNPAGVFPPSPPPPPPAPGPPPPPTPPPPPPPGPVSPAEIRDLGNFPSALLGNTHRIRVYLPPGYVSGSARYPVLYIQDGEVAFGANNMQFDSVATALIAANAIRPLIMIAIHTSSNRAQEYVPFVGGCCGALYARMMVEELKPAIDAQVRTLPGPDDTGATGGSLGGIITWYLGLWHTGTFHLIASQSGGLTVSDTLMMRTVRGLPAKLPLRIYFDRGTLDGEAANQVVEQVMLQALHNQGWVDGVDVKYVLVPGAVHSVAAFSQRVDQILKFLFPPG